MSDDEEEDIEELRKRLQRERFEEEQANNHARDFSAGRHTSELLADHVAAQAAADAEEDRSAAIVEKQTRAAAAIVEEQTRAAHRELELMERSFSQGSSSVHLLRWQMITAALPLTLELTARTDVASVLPLVVASCASLRAGVSPCQRLLRLRLSRAMAEAVHEALQHISVLSITDINVASARTLATFCTGLCALNIGLPVWGISQHEQFLPLVLEGGVSSTQNLFGLGVVQSTPDWLKADGANALLEAFATLSTLSEVRGSNLTWNNEAGPHGFEPMGFWDDWRGRWSRYEQEWPYSGMAPGDDEDYNRGEEGLVRLGLDNTGLSFLSGIHTLDLTGCQCVTDEGVSGICRRSPNLEVLGLGKCSGVSDLTLVAIAQHCPQLQGLDLQRHIPADDDLAMHGPHITAAGLEALVHGCVGLRELNLAGQTSLLGTPRNLRSATPQGATAVGALVDTLEARGVRVDTSLIRTRLNYLAFDPTLGADEELGYFSDEETSDVTW